MLKQSQSAAAMARMEGIFISTDRPVSRTAFMAADLLFGYAIGFYLTVLYFVSMSHTIYRDTNEFQGNNDFYVVRKS